MAGPAETVRGVDGGRGDAAPGETGGSAEDAPSYGSGARVLSIGIASTGIFTFAYLATASHVLSPGTTVPSLCAGRSCS